MFGRTMKLARVALTMAALGCAAPLAAQAQESKTTWRISQPSGNSTQYKTQQEAVQAIKSLPAPSPFPPEFQFGWQSVNSIKSKAVDLEGNTSITYWMGKSQPSDPDWSYLSTAQFPTEEAMVAAYLADIKAFNPVCPGAAVTPTSEWYALSPDMEGTIETRDFEVIYMTGDNTAESPCTPYPSDAHMTRTRRLNCPVPLTQWSNKHEACVSEEFVATITSKTTQCDKDGGNGNCPTSGNSAMSGMSPNPSSTSASQEPPCTGAVGNPCDVKTGEKYEIAQDFDLRWIALTRYYHTGISTSSGGFGHGWTHSLGAQLALDGAGGAGIVEATGFQRAFKKIG